MVEGNGHICFKPLLFHRENLHLCYIHESPLAIKKQLLFSMRDNSNGGFPAPGAIRARDALR
jgi:hypothetical protein